MYLTIKSQNSASNERVSWIQKAVTHSGFSIFPSRYLKFSTVKLNRLFWGLWGTFLPAGRQMLPSDLHLRIGVRNSKFLSGLCLVSNSMILSKSTYPSMPPLPSPTNGDKNITYHSGMWQSERIRKTVIHR